MCLSRICYRGWGRGESLELHILSRGIVFGSESQKNEVTSSSVCSSAISKKRDFLRSGKITHEEAFRTY